MYLPPVQGCGRVDNPEHYRVLYASDAPIGAIAEIFRNHAVWTADLFRVPVLPGASLALATYDARRVRLLDLDDARSLLDRELRPSDVVTRDRERTQRWSLAIYREQKWDGVRWWSLHEPDQGPCGLWNVRSLKVIDITALSLDHELVVESARMMNRTIEM